MDMTNLKKLAPNKWRVRFKYTDPLTGLKEVYHKTLDGTYEDARRHRDLARAECLRTTKEKMDDRQLKSFTPSFLTDRAKRGRGKKKLARATLQRDAFALENHILPRAGDWIVSRITVADIENLVDTWCLECTDYSPATINTWIKVLKLFVAYAAKKVGISNPAEHVENLYVPPSERGTALTYEQVGLVLDWLKEHRPQHWCMALVGFTTGARFSELSALHWDQVDFDEGVLQLDHCQYEGHRREGTKSGPGVHVPLLGEVADAFVWHRDRMRAKSHPQAYGEIVFPARVGDVRTAKYNGYLSRTALKNALALACKKVDVPHITPHDMRYTFNTLMMEAQVNAVVVQSITGHKTDRMTKQYTKVHMETQSEALAPHVLRVIDGGRVNEGSTNDAHKNKNTNDSKAI